ncbi:MAG: PAS domain S-box protein [Candidatus Korobacteraceae bacterium]
MKQSGIDANESVTHRSSRPMRRIHLQHYALAILSVAVALGASLVFEHFHFRVPSALLLLFAVAISSWYGGPGPAALAVLLSVVTFYWYFVQPVQTFYIYWSQIPYFILFTAFAALVSWLGTVRQRVEADLRQSRDLLREQASILSPALRLALIYAFFGALWILVSDRLSFYLVPDLQLAERLQTYKGWFFIAVTSVLLWLLATRFLSQVRAAEEVLHRLNRKLQAISNCNQTLLRATDEPSLLEQICRIVCEEAGYRMAFVAFAEHDEAKSVRPVVWSGAEEGYLATVGFTWADTELGRGPTGMAIRSGKTCCTEDFATDSRVAPWRESALQHGYRSSIALPLKDEHGKAFGSLTIYSAQPNTSTPEEVRLLEELAGDLAFGIVTLRSGAARKRAEEALRESETRFRTFVDHAGDALFVYDLEKRTVIDVNRQACESIGYTRQELIGKTPDAFHLKSYQAEMGCVIERAAAGETVFDTHWHRRKDGSTFAVEVHTSLVSYGGRRFLLKVARDITDRLRAEEAIRQNERQLREVIEGIPAIASTIRLDGSVEFINKRWQEYTGMSTEESVGPGWQSAGHPQDMGHYLERRRAALASGDPFEDEARIRSRDGQYRWFLLRGAPLRDARGNIVRWYATAIDIDDRKRAEEVRLEERVRERTRIARELHDTLLQSFHGTLLHFQAASSLLPTRTAEAKKMLDSAIDMAAQAITEGRDAIQGLRLPEVEVNDLAVAIRAFGESLAVDRGDHGSPIFQVELVGVARELDPTFAGEVYRIAIEALRNSFQHAEARHIKVEIHHEEEEFRVFVRDDGKGIDSKSLAAEGPKGHYGLHGMRERAKLIGSEIMIRSEVGAGTEIELRVPAVTAYAACGVILATHSRP